MASLSASELLKPGREYRSLIIVKKMNAGEPFELTNGKRVKFLKNKNVIKVLSSDNKTSSELNTIRFLDEDGNEYRLSDISKTADFGGKGERSSVAKEDAALESLNDQIEKAKKELMSATVPILIKGKTYHAAYAESTPGTPKSDFHLVDTDGKEIAWISHKDGKGPRDFQQWGGISERSEPTIFRHRETQKFVSDLKKNFPKGLPPATTLYRKIKDDQLKMMSVYGNAYGGTMGRQNVTILLQGPIKLVKSGNKYKLDANNVHYNGESVDDGGFEPVLMAIYKGDRSDAGVKGTRIVISPVGGRKGTEFP